MPRFLHETSEPKHQNINFFCRHTLPYIRTATSALTRKKRTDGHVAVKAADVKRLEHEASIMAMAVTTMRS